MKLMNSFRGLLCPLVSAVLFLIAAQTCLAVPAKDALEVYPVPAGLPIDARYEIEVRGAGGEWRHLAAYRVAIDQVADSAHQLSDAAMAYFDFAGRVEVSVTSSAERVRSVRIRPNALGISADVTGDRFKFVLAQPCNLSIEINGDIFHNLHLFAGRIHDVPSAEDQNVVRFGPGVHLLPDGRLDVATGQTIYFEGGSVIRGQIVCSHVENVRICGRGYFDGARSGLLVVGSRNVQIDGLMLTRSINIAESEHVVVRDVKTISHGAWGDGIDVYCSNHVLIQDVFLRTSDDCIAIYAHRNRWSGDSSDVQVQRATLWADVAHPILIGTHGNTRAPETISNVCVRDVDILDHCEGQLDYQGCLSVNASDSNLVRDVRFEDIRVDDFRRGQLVNLRVAWNRKYATSPGRGIENVYFKNVAYHGTRANPSIIAGYDDARTVRNVVFENLVINGRVISDRMQKPGWYHPADMANFFVGEHVDGLVFLGPGESAQNDTAGSVSDQRGAAPPGQRSD